MALYKVIKRLVGKAIFGYKMLEPKDTVLIALSGGEDSLVLTYFLSEWKAKIRTEYNLIGVHLDMGFIKDETIYEKSLNWLRTFCKSLGVGFYYEKTDYGKLAIEAFEKNTSNPCFVCSWYRRKHLFKLAEKFQANKIAFGHHKDDVIVTFFLNMFYNGELSTILPVQEMFKGKLYLIRPLFFVEKDLITRFVKARGWNVLENPCPFRDKTKRKFVDTFLRDYVYSIDPRIKRNIFSAIFNPKPEYLPKKSNILRREG